MAGTIVKKFKSPNDFLEWATTAESPWTGELSSRRERDSSWAGTADYDEAYKLARYGWKKGLDQLSAQVKVAAKLSPQARNPRKKYDVAGDEMDFARAAAGDPMAMILKGKSEKAKPIIKIRMNVGYSASVDSEDIMRWGGAVCSYIERLEKAGFSTQLDTFMESKSDSGPSVSFQFPLKKAGSRLDLSDVAFWWGHPSAIRRVEFSAIERLDIERHYSGGYGYPAVVEKPEPGVLFLNIADARRTSQECLDAIFQKHQDVLKEHPIPGLAMAQGIEGGPEDP